MSNLYKENIVNNINNIDTVKREHDNTNHTNTTNQIQELSIDNNSIYNSPFVSLYTPLYASVNDNEPMTAYRTPSIPYNYMPRPSYTTTPGDLPAFNSLNNVFLYIDTNYAKPVKDVIIERRILDFENPLTMANFLPVATNTTLIP